MKNLVGKILIFAFLISILTACFVAPRGTATVYAKTDALFTAIESSVDEGGAKAEKDTRHYGVILVKFSDSKDFDEGFEDKILKTYNTSPLSVKKYFETVSNGLYDVEFSLASIDVITLPKKQSYYEPKYYYTPITGRYEVVNENGYDNRYFDENGNPCAYSETGNKRHIDRLLREQSLLNAIIKAVSESYSGADLDSDNDGIIDGLHLIFSTQDKEYSWDEILWTHKSNYTLYSEDFLRSNYYIPSDFELSPVDFLPCYINKKVVDDYAVFSSTKIKETVIQDSNKDKIYSCGIFAHEILHDLGLSDYYSYSKTGVSGELYDNNPVGELDIMGGAQVLPQMPLSFTMRKLGWITDENICPIEYSGSYVLYPSTSDKKIKAYKLVLPDYEEIGEYFMIEARSGGGEFIDGNLSGSGIIVYKINEKNGFIGADGNIGLKNYGNMYGGNEVYVYRLADKELSDNKNGSYAILDGRKFKTSLEKQSVYVDSSTIGSLDKSADKTVIDQVTGYLTTSLFYENGQNSGIKISQIAATDDGGYSFKIEFDETIFDKNSFARLSKYYDGKSIAINWSVPTRKGTATVYVCSANGITKYKNGEYVLKKKVTAKMLESGTVYGNGVIDKKKFAVSYGSAIIPTYEDEVAVFLVYDGDGEAQTLFAGVLNPHMPDFSEYLFGTTKWVVLIIVIIVFFVAVAAVVIFLMVKKEKSKKDGNNDNDDMEKLQQLYGENYWLKEQVVGNVEEETLDENIFENENSETKVDAEPLNDADEETIQNE